MAELRRAPLWLGPAFLLAVAAACSTLADVVAPNAAAPLLLLFAALLVLGPLPLYSWLRWRGAAPPAAAAGALLTPLLWLAKECIAVGRLFGVGPGLYYALNPLALGLIAGAALQMAAAELAVGRLRSGRWPFRSGAAAILVLLAILGGTYALTAARHDASFAFWIYIDGYRKLFAAAS